MTDIHAVIAELKALEAKATRYPGYFVDIMGNVWSNSNWRGYGTRKLTPYPNSHGYMRVKIHASKECKSMFIHTEVCRLFHGEKPTQYHEVRHLNGDRADNRAENLAWGTRSENALDRCFHGTSHSANNGRKSVEKMLRTRRERHGF